MEQINDSLEIVSVSAAINDNQFFFLSEFFSMNFVRYSSGLSSVFFNEFCQVFLRIVIFFGVWIILVMNGVYVFLEPFDP